MEPRIDTQDSSGHDPASQTQHRLLDAVAQQLGAKNDAALSRLLGVAPPQLSKIRRGRLPVGATMLLRLHEITDMSIRDLRALLNDGSGATENATASAGALPPRHDAERRPHR